MNLLCQQLQFQMSLFQLLRFAGRNLFLEIRALLHMFSFCILNYDDTLMIRHFYKTGQRPLPVIFSIVTTIQFSLQFVQYSTTYCCFLLVFIVVLCCGIHEEVHVWLCPSEFMLMTVSDTRQVSQSHKSSARFYRRFYDWGLYSHEQDYIDKILFLQLHLCIPLMLWQVDYVI